MKARRPRQTAAPAGQLHHASRSAGQGRLYGYARHGLSRQEVEHEIEVASGCLFWETLIFGIDGQLEVWISLEEGLRTADLHQKLGEDPELIRRVREFIVYDGPEFT